MRIAPAEFHIARHRRARQDLDAGRLSALLVTSLPNISYLTGLFASAAALVVTADRLHLVVDGRYVEAARSRETELPNLSVVVVPAAGSLLGSAAAVLKHRGLLRVGIEATSMTVRQHTDLLADLPRAAELVATTDAIEQHRAVKDSWELQALREAGGRLSDAAKCIIPKALAGLSERQLAVEADGELRRVGFEKTAFDTIVASGPNSAIPHYRAGDRRLEAGDLVVVDFGGVLDGYAVDMTRTVTIGPPGPRQRRLLDHVAEAQVAAFSAVRPGRAAEDVDASARAVLDRGGYGEGFSHGTGHGLGLEVHERPRVSRCRPGRAAEILQASMVFTLEPGAYFPGWGGVRIEDDIAVTGDGAEWLTDAPRP